MRRRLQLRHAGKALLSCIVAVNLLCFLTLYSLHSDASRPPAQPPLPWQQPTGQAADSPRGVPGEVGQGERINNKGAGSQSRDLFDSPCKEIAHAPDVPEVEDTWKTVVANGT